jgi:hypothetical protein
MSAFEKIKRGLEEARAFARGECEHEWKVEYVYGPMVTRQCPKCGIRVTNMPDSTN